MSLPVLKEVSSRNEQERARWAKSGKRMPHGSKFERTGELEMAMLEFIERNGNRVSKPMLKEAFEDLTFKPNAFKSRIDGLRRFLGMHEQKMIPIPDVDPRDALVRWYRITSEFTAGTTNIVARISSAASRLDGVNKDLRVLRTQPLSEKQKAILGNIAVPALACNEELGVAMTEAKALGFDVDSARKSVERPTDEELGLVEASSIEERGSSLRKELADARERGIKGFHSLMETSTVVDDKKDK